jgi:flagellar basal body-associated protein FliL
MKKIDVEKDYKRTRFLIVAMVVQIVVVVLLLAAYTMWLRW